MLIQIIANILDIGKLEKLSKIFVYFSSQQICYESFEEKEVFHSLHIFISQICTIYKNYSSIHNYTNITTQHHTTRTPIWGKNK